MSFRAKLLAAFALAVVIPLLLLAVVLPREMSKRFGAQYDERLRAISVVIRSSLDNEHARNKARLTAVANELRRDVNVRIAIMNEAAEREELLNYGERAALRSGLDILQIQNDSGRILTSAHFRNEFDRVDSALMIAMSAAPDGGAIVKLRKASGPAVALATFDTARVGTRLLTLIGGVELSSQYLTTLGQNPEVAVSLVLGDSVVSSTSSVDTVPQLPRTVFAASSRADSIVFPYIDATGTETEMASARFELAHSATQLQELLSDTRRWIFGTLIIATAAALVVAAWLSSRLSEPLAELTAETARIDLDKPSGRFTLANRNDEIGVLASKLTAMMERVRASATRLRDAERRATMGELARQVNHDIKNGLTPIRNVVRHLGQITKDKPGELAAAFAERQQTLESSIEYLDTLARNYAKLSPRMDVTPSDVRPVIEDVKRGAAARGVTLATSIPSQIPPVLADAAVIRRVLENLVGNAIEAVEGNGGNVSITAAAESTPATGNIPMLKLTVADTGKGMSEMEMQRAFDDFFTTKSGGTGLGLSVVRRLVADVSGILKIESEPGKGTRVAVFIPVATARTSASANDRNAQPPSNKPAFK